jgi:pimeloyl-ACP methyl ester carboxylesterase
VGLEVVAFKKPVRAKPMLTFKQPEVVVVGGRRLAYEEVRPLDPKGVIILLCGIGAKRQGWYKQLQVFGRSYRTLALDYRDVGDSDQANEPYSIGDLAEDIAELMQQLGIAKGHLVGISMGGFISLELALRHAELVDKLVLVVTSAGGSAHVSTSREVMTLLLPGDEEIETGAGARRVCAAVAAPGFAGSHPKEIDEFVEIALYRPMTRAGYLRQLQACRAHDVSKKLDQITAPTLIIHGELDPLVVLQNGLYLARHIKGASLIVYPDTGHIPEVEREDEFNRDILTFLEV